MALSIAAGTAIAGGLAAAGAVGGSALTTGLGFKSQSRQFAFNSAEAQKQRDFEEYMSSSAYTRAVADMERAGLNPAAIGSGLSSASTPSGSAASGGSAKIADFSNIFSDAVAMAMAKDKNLTSKVISEMQTASARECTDLRNAGRLQVEEYRKDYDHAAYRKPAYSDMKGASDLSSHQKSVLKGLYKKL